MLRRLTALAVLVASATAPAMAQDLTEAARRVFERSVVSIGKGAVSGSGIVVSDEGHVITALHVLKAISQRSNRNISFFRTRYRAWLNVANIRGVTGCSIGLQLIAADATRDVAVLKMNDRNWSTRSESPCLQDIEPARFKWEFEFAENGDAEAAEDDESRPLFGGAIYVMGRPSGCDDCESPDFNWFASNLHRKADEFGLHVVTEEVLPGFSGGPAVLESGEVIGMIVASGKDLKVPQVKLAPISLLHRPLWTFGLVNFGGEEGVGDYVDLMIQLLKNKKKIDEMLEKLEKIEKEDLAAAIETFAEIKNQMDRPVFVESTINPVPMGSQVRQFVTLAYSKQIKRARVPKRGNFSIECVPRDDLGYSKALATSALAGASETHKSKIRDLERILNFTATPFVPDESSERMEFTIFQPLDDVLNACAEYFDVHAEISGQTVKFSPEVFTRLKIAGSVDFEDASAESHSLELAVIELDGGV